MQLLSQSIQEMTILSSYQLQSNPFYSKFQTLENYVDMFTKLKIRDIHHDQSVCYCVLSSGDERYIIERWVFGINLGAHIALQ